MSATEQKSSINRASILNHYSLDEYISRPLSASDLKNYEENGLRCFAYEKKIGIIAIPCSISCGVFCSSVVAVLSGEANIFELFFLGLCVASLLYASCLLSLGKKSLEKFPMALVIDGVDYVVGTTGCEFVCSEVDSGSLADGSKAKALLDAIQSMQRPVMAFEKKLIEKLVFQK